MSAQLHTTGRNDHERKEDRPSGTHNRACAVVAETIVSNMDGTHAEGIAARQVRGFNWIKGGLI